MTAAAAPDANPAELAVYRLEAAPGAPVGPATPTADDREWTEPLLRDNAIWFCQLRWLVVAVLFAVAASGLLPELPASLGLKINPVWPGTAAALLAVLNLVFSRLARRAVAGTGQGHPLRAVLWAQIVSDLLILTAVIHWLGPDWPAAPFMYLFHIILACLVFSPGESLAVAGLAAGSHGLTLWAVAAGWVPRSSVLAPRGPTGEGFVPAGGFAAMIPMLLIWAVIWYLVSRLAATLRRREHELARTNRRLAASIEERAKHMLQTTHQLKAPFAAIHAMSQVLLGGYAGALPPSATQVVEKIATRCLALSRQIQEMLQLANLRSRGQAEPPRRPLDLAAVVGEVVARVEPAARQRHIHLDTALAPAPVSAVADHVTMLVDNLLVNAVTYSHDGGVVEVACGPQPGAGARLIVRDHGIGIPREKLPHIFEDYYRTEEAVRHNRASTGLGLAIVRQVACTERVAVQVESAPGWGTRFTVTWPGPAAATS